MIKRTVTNNAIHVRTAEDENERFINCQNREAALIIRQQDEQLTELGNSIDRLGQIGRTVKEELDVLNPNNPFMIMASRFTRL
jgi:hypothetical protein